MKADFSEFTYGFALVNELTKVLSCKAVPLFPSLREEGKAGGGYDVKIEGKNGAILHLQFKLSEFLKRTNAREYGLPGHSLKLPYYRFEITNNRISQQHKLLRILENEHPQTFYVAPMFYKKSKIESFWQSTEVTKHSVFVKPSSIGDLSDGLTHRICFDKSLVSNNQAYLFSNPKEIDVHTFENFSEGLISQVKEERKLTLSIEHVLQSYAAVIKSIDSRIHQPSLEHSEEKEFLLSKPIDRNRQGLIEHLLDPPEGSDLLRLVAEVSFFVLGVQAVAVIQD